MLRVLHTSDWHLGRSLYGKNRYVEFEKFLNWLVEFIKNNSVDVLLIAGDIFDTTTPSNKAQELYYSFLSQIARTGCRKVIITAGNHDSPTFLAASKSILSVVDVDVVGYYNQNPESEIIEFKNSQGKAELIVCAVPYLRERDVRVSEGDESLEDRASRLNSGIIDHYITVGELARKKADGVPIIALGHLFAAGARAEEGTGVRELYVGTLAHLDAGAFPSTIDYYALGHLHMEQKVGGRNNIRYCGSPLAMGFGESDHDKCILQLDFADGEVTPNINKITVPVFQQLKKITGELDIIMRELSNLKENEVSVWVEIEYTGQELIPDLHDRIEEIVAGSMIEVRRVRNNSVLEVSLEQMDDRTELELADMNDLEIFKKRLEDGKDVPENMQDELLFMYKQLRTELLEEDENAL